MNHPVSLNLWQPTASIETLRRRSALTQRIRQFFADRGVLEVDTPAMGAFGVTDLHLHNFSTKLLGPAAPHGQTLYLQTSPEFHMKRLLAAGSGAIYQICKSFRNEEAGRLHNPEFTMLEWYRPGFDHHQLMDEMDALLQQLLDCERAERFSYQQAFVHHLGLDPLSASDAELSKAGEPFGITELLEQESNRDSQLQLLFAVGIEPQIGQQRPCFIDCFPASQASLARLSSQDPRVAERFEVYFKGIELANGFHELADGAEQRRRFEHDNSLREANGLVAMGIDERLLAALDAPLPDCAGVALGLDRVFILALDQERIAQVISFGHERA
ncbi:elongation factor P--(R)-beta-lysine ligase [Celerinatantimonas yamalensis]|uniref:Elongation factor P--(R)-beta-lysine ligase n=1 Tax=Celerinatantimonas yamalensis TaxID=559956 RepID=A0ABW9G5A3_9GAMM